VGIYAFEESAVEGSSNVEVRELISQIKQVDFIMHRKLWRQLNIAEKPGPMMMMARLRKSEVSSPRGLRVSELASAFGVSSSGITQMVTNLEERGYVGRSMDPEDRRAVRVFLTEEGIRAADSMIHSLDIVFGGLIDHLGPEKSRALLALLTEVSTYFDGRESQSPTNSCTR
jgi:DNA-binding MarR family transcriptional regulator